MIVFYFLSDLFLHFAKQNQKLNERITNLTSKLEIATEELSKTEDRRREKSVENLKQFEKMTAEVSKQFDKEYGFGGPHMG